MVQVVKPVHKLSLSRRVLGRSPIGRGAQLYGTVWRCSCDGQSHRINLALSKGGGNAQAKAAWKRHVTELEAGS